MSNEQEKYTPGSEPVIWDDDEKVLRARAIRPEYAFRLGCHSADLAALREHREEYGKHGWKTPYPGLPLHRVRVFVIPYTVATPLDGLPRYRARCHETRHMDDEGNWKENSRYIASVGSVIPYWTPEVIEIAGDVSKPLFATEAPLKAMSLSCNGFPAFGMGGVLAGAHDVDTRKETGAITAGDEFKRIKWSGRRLYIVYDASLVDPKKPLISLGAAYLAVAARGLGADVWLVRIPPMHAQDSDPQEGVIYSETDQGPDDFIARCGVDAFLGLMSQDETCHPIDPTARLREPRLVVDDAGQCTYPKDKVKAERKARAIKLLGDLPALAFLYAAGPVAISEFATDSGLSRREIDAAVKTYRERLSTKDKGDRTSFVVDNGRFCLRTQDGIEPVSNFTAQITHAVDYRSASGETVSKWTIKGLVEGQDAGETVVDPVAFHKCEPWWSAYGTRATIAAGRTAKEAVRQAIQEHSPAITPEVVYQHTGWVKDGDQWSYLHAGGAIGGEHKRVELPEKYAHFRFGEPVADLRASLALSDRLLWVASQHVSLPLFAANRLAVLASILNPAFSVWVIAETTAGKTTVAKLFQCEFGDFHRMKGMVQNFESTPTSVERGMNRAKDATLVVDDYCPKAILRDAEKQKTLAHMLIRQAGNGQSRGRALSSTEERPDYPPMGLVVCTAEEDPVGDDGAASLNARMLKLHMAKGNTTDGSPADANWRVITEVQETLAEDHMALTHGMRAFIAWLAPQYEDSKTTLVRERDALLADLRRKYGAKLGARQPDVIANLVVAVRLYARFAIEAGAWTSDAASNVEEPLLRLLLEGAAGQLGRDDLRKPEMVYMRIVEAMLSNKTITLAPTATSMTKQDVGWYIGTVAYVNSTLLDKAVAEHLQRKGQRLAASFDEIRSAMKRRGWIEPDGAHLCWKQSAAVSETRERVILRMPFDAFDIDLAKILEEKKECDDGAPLGAHDGTYEQPS